MKKTSTIRVNGNMIFKGHKLTIGLDLGDRWLFYCVLDEAGQIILEQNYRRHRSDEADFWKDTAKSHGPGDRDPFPVGKPAVTQTGRHQ